LIGRAYGLVYGCSGIWFGCQAIEDRQDCVLHHKSLACAWLFSVKR
jgi:hypothetical protein